jgi:fibronectin-binding autotransporter adhesin
MQSAIVRLRHVVVGLVVLSCSVASAPLHAQGIISLTVGGGGKTMVAPGSKVTLPVVIDMTSAAGRNLSSIATALNWDSNRLTLDSVKTAGFGTFTANTAGASGGAATLGTSSASGTTTTVTLGNAYFTASPTAGSARVSVTPSSAMDVVGANILSTVRTRNLDVCVGPTGPWGDGNGDGSVNIIDAQQVARFSVGLVVANSIAITYQGDVNADNSVNIIDAQQVARFSVGLSATARINTAAFTPPAVSSLNIANVLDAAAGATNPGVAANVSNFVVGTQAQLIPLARDAGSVDVTSCAALTYASSNAAVATVSSSGLVTAVSSGTATVTATSGSVSSGVTFTVVSSAGGALANNWTNTSGGLWSTAANWSLGRVPQATDSVVIAAPGTYTVTMDVNFTASYITVGGGSGTQGLTMSSRTLTLNGGALTIKPGATLGLVNSTVTGAGALANQGTFTFNGGTINTSLDNQGVLVVPAGNAAVVNGTLTTGSNSTIRAQANGSVGAANLVVANGFTNNGLIELTNINGGGQPVNLTVSSGTLVNATGATITSLATGGGSRTITAQLDNQGTLALAQGLTLGRTSAAHQNSGTIALTGGDLTLNLNSGAASFTTSGTLTIAAGRTFGVTGGTFTHNGGALSGAGTLAINGTAFNLTQPFSNSAVNFTPINSTINGSALLTNAAGQALAITGSTINAPLDNQGLLFVSAGNAASVTGALTTGTSSTIRLQSNGSVGASTLVVANGFTNNGLIELTNINAGGQPANLTVNNGTLVNASGATITSLASGGGTRTVSAQLDNQGTLSLDQGLTLGRTSAAHQNSGTITLTGGDLTLNLNSGAASFTTSGTLTIGAGRTVSVTGGTVTHSGGTVSGGGTLAINGTTFTLTQPFSNSAINFTPFNSVINGSALLTNVAGQTLTITGTTINAPLDNQGLLFIAGGNAAVLNGALTTASTSTIRAQANGSVGAANLVVANGFTNNGLIELTNINAGGQPATLTVSNGTLVNASGATITSLATAGGARTLSAQLDNQGTLALAQALTLSRTSAVHQNSGTIALTGGDLTLNLNSGAASFTTSGTLTIGAGRTFGVTGGTFTHNGGTLSGTGTLAINGTAFNLTQPFSNSAVSFTPINSTINGSALLTNAAGQTLAITGSTINAPLDNQGLLFVSAGNAASVTGTLTTGSGSTIRLQSNGSVGASTLVVANGFTNNGLIELTNINAGGQPANLTVNNGTLVNAPGATITSLATGGGARTVSAQLNNQGTLSLDQGLTLSRTGAAHQNTGTITLTGGDLTLNLNSGVASFTTSGTLTIPAGRTFSVTGGTLTHGGGTVSGTGTLAINGTTFNLTQPFSNSAVNFTPINSTINGTALLTNAAGQTLAITGSTINTPLDNQGLLFVSAGNAASVTGALTTASTSTIRLQANGSVGAATLVVANGFTNNGLIELTNINAGGQPANLTVNNGTLVNASGATITSLATGGGTRTLTAQLDNQGTLSLAQGLTLGRTSAAHQNSGTITLTGGDLTLNLNSGVASFTTSGTVTIGAGRIVSVTGGTVTHNGGTLSGGGTLAINGTTFNLTQPFSNSAIGFSPTNSTINGSALFTNATGQTLTITGSTINAPLDNQGLLFVSAGNAASVNGALTTGSNSTIRLQSNGSVGAATLTVANGFTNNSLIELTNINAGGQPVTLAVTTGTLVNGPAGAITSLATGGAQRTIAASVNNQGTISVGPNSNQPFRITGSLTTSGTLRFELGGTTAASGYGQLAVSGAATLGGVLDIANINGFTPASGQTFTPLTYASHLGTFGQWPGGMNISENATTVTLAVP